MLFLSNIFDRKARRAHRALRIRFWAGARKAHILLRCCCFEREARKTQHMISFVGFEQRSRRSRTWNWRKFILRQKAREKNHRATSALFWDRRPEHRTFSLSDMILRQRSQRNRPCIRETRTPEHVIVQFRFRDKQARKAHMAHIAVLFEPKSQRNRTCTSPTGLFEPESQKNRTSS